MLILVYNPFTYLQSIHYNISQGIEIGLISYLTGRQIYQVKRIYSCMYVCLYVWLDII